MRRVLVFTLLIAGSCLLLMTAMLGFARQKEPKEWMFVSQDGAFYRLSLDGTQIKKLADIDVVQIKFFPERNVAIAAGRYPNSIDSDLFRINFAADSFRSLVDTPNDDFFVTWILEQDQFIFYSHPQDGTLSLYVAEENGDDIRPLLSPDTFDMHFGMWLPDRQGMIVYAQTGNGYDIFKVNPDFSVETLVAYPTDDVPLRLTANGEWLLFQRYGNYGGIYRMRLDGTHEEYIHSSAFPNEFWTLSPDGEWIVFGLRTVRDVFRVRVDGSDFQQLTADLLYKEFRGLSGNGEWIVYSGTLSNTEHRLLRMRLDGSEQEYLGDLSYRDKVFWSPEREWLIFREPANENSPPSLHSFDFATNATFELNIYQYMMWSVDSDWLYYMVEEGGKQMLARMHPNGTQREILREVSDNFRFVAWSPIIDLNWSRALLATVATIGILLATMLSFFTHRLIQRYTIL